MLSTVRWFVLAAAAVLLTAGAVKAQSVEILTGEWAPFVSQDLPDYGFTAEIVTAAFEAAGITPEYRFEKWSRISSLIKNGEAFAAFPYLKTPEREEFALFSQRFADSRNVFFYNKKRLKNFEYNSLEQIKNMRVGGLRGYFYVETFKDAGIELDYTRFPELSFKKLLHGRIDLFPSNELVGWELIKKQFPDQVDSFAATKSSFSESGLFLMVSKTFPDSKKLLETFNKGLASIMENGEYEKILEKYGLSSS